MDSQDGRDRPARLVIVDDQDLVRAGLRSTLAGRADLLIAGEGRSGRDAVALCAALQPDLVLMDLHLPETNGLEARDRTQAAVRALT